MASKVKALASAEEEDQQVEGKGEKSSPKQMGKGGKKLKKKATTTTSDSDSDCAVELNEDETEAISCLGLGKAIDATHPHPWASKSAYQAKEVILDDVAVINEGHHIRIHSEKVENHFEIQGSLETSLKVPDKPIEVGVAVDASRSLSDTKMVHGKTIATRTVAFKVLKGDKVRSKSTFESDLKHWMESHGCNVEEEMQRGIELCHQFIEQLGGVSHYVSSVTLGAMVYRSKSTLSKKMSTNTSASLSMERVGSAKSSTSVKKDSWKMDRDVEKIGRITNRDHVRTHSGDEAVIRYSFTSLSNLVSERALRECVQEAIQQYIDKSMTRRSGPYYIHCTEPTRSDELLYWKIFKDTSTREVKHVVGLTTSTTHASYFYIELDYSTLGEHFYITTFDCGVQVDSYNPEELEETDTIIKQASCPTFSRVRSLTGNAKPSFERYIHFECEDKLAHKPGGVKIRLLAKSTVNRKRAKFQVVDRRHHCRKTLGSSGWLPQARSGSQPCYIQPYNHHYCLAVKVEDSNPKHPLNYQFQIKSKSKHSEGHRHMLFTLVPAAELSPATVATKTAADLA